MITTAELQLYDLKPPREVLCTEGGAGERRIRRCRRERIRHLSRAPLDLSSLLGVEGRVGRLGLPWATVQAMAASASAANARCRARDRYAHTVRVMRHVDRHLTLLRASGAPEAVDAWIAVPPSEAPDADERNEEEDEARAEAMALLSEVEDGPSARYAARVADGIMADLGIACDEEAWSRGYQWRYTAAMRERDFRALTLMAVRMGVMMVGPVMSNGALAHGREFGVDAPEDLAGLALSVLWELLAGYKPGRLSPLGWVRRYYFRRLQSCRNQRANEQIDARGEAIRLEDAPEDLLGASPPAEDGAEEDLLRQRVIEALGDAKGRLAWLVVVRGHSLPEAAALVGVKERTANYWWHEAGANSIPARLRVVLADLEEGR